MVIDPTTVSGIVSYRLLTACVAPRPIALVSTISAAGVPNVAPFSFFNALCGEPPTVCFAPSYRVPPKDTLVNIQANGEFVVNVVSEEIAEKMNVASGEYPPEVDEFPVSGLTPVPSVLVQPPRVKESQVNMECKVRQIIELSSQPQGGTLVIGEVVLFHIDEAVLNGAVVDPGRLNSIGRMGGRFYSRTRDLFTMPRPTVSHK